MAAAKAPALKAYQLGLLRVLPVGRLPRLETLPASPQTVALYLTELAGVAARVVLRRNLGNGLSPSQDTPTSRCLLRNSSSCSCRAAA